MTRRFGSSLWISLLIPILGWAQSRVGQWDSHTSFLDVRDAIEHEGKIICATSGGLLVFDRNSRKFETLTNIDGLVETDLSTLAIDRNGHLWTGSSSPRGLVQVYDLETREAVQTFDFGLTEITDIVTSDSAVFAAYSRRLDWGILEFVWRDGEYVYRQIYKPSDQTLDTIAGLAIRGDSLFAATDRGLFVGDYRRFILNYPQNWHSLTGFELDSVSVLKRDGPELLMVASGEIWSYGTTLERLSDTYSGKTSLTDIGRLADGSLYGVVPWRLVHFGDQGIVDKTWGTRANPARLSTLTDNKLLLTTDLGIALWDPLMELFEWYSPNSPVSNVYTALTVLDDGRLVAAGKDGVSILSEEGWYNFVPSFSKSAFYDHEPGDFSSFVADTAQYKSARVWSVVEQNGRIFFSLQGVFPGRNDFGDPIGGGLVSFDLNDPWDYVVYDTSNGMLDFWDLRGYMNVRGLYGDRDNNLWIANFAAGDEDKKITVLTSGDKWLHIPQSDLSSSERMYNPTDIMVLDDGTVIVGGSRDHIHQGGIFVLDVDLTAESLSPQWNSFFENDGLAAGTVWSFDSGEQRVIWALTSGGLQRLEFNSDFTQVIPYFFTYFAGVPFGEGSKASVDGRGNVWVSSVTAGVYVLLANSTPWPDWNGFRHGNSPLLSDEVTAVAFDNREGIAYIATSKGINSLRIPFAERKETYVGVTTFPSPFRIPSMTPMVIDGLMDNSSLKIMTLSGRVLRSIQSTSPSVNGYQAFWDGRTSGGEYVGTGVYLVAIHSDGGDSHVTKIAVIRE